MELAWASAPNGHFNIIHLNTTEIFGCLMRSTLETPPENVQTILFRRLFVRFFFEHSVIWTSSVRWPERHQPTQLTEMVVYLYKPCYFHSNEPNMIDVHTFVLNGAEVNTNGRNGKRGNKQKKKKKKK